MCHVAFLYEQYIYTKKKYTKDYNIVFKQQKKQVTILPVTNSL